MLSFLTVFMMPVFAHLFKVWSWYTDFMMRCVALFLYSLLISNAAVAAEPTPERTVRVDYVIDGDTFTTKSGETVRLLAINTPEKRGRDNKPEPFAMAATDALKNLIAKQEVTLKFDNNPKDRYGRTLAHVYLPRDQWVNEAMLASGLAHVYSFPDNQSHLNHLLTIEAQARQAEKGLWADPRWAVKNAHTAFTKNQIGQFHLVGGTVRDVAQVKGTVYLNFGEDWRTDFTAEIPADAQAYFDLVDFEKHFHGKEVLVRGRLKPVNGVLISVSHPAQIQVLK